MHTPLTHCSFAFPGTYGHECGAPATLAGKAQSDITTNGIYWARRCAKCATYQGGENHGIAQFVPFDPAVHINKFR